VSVRSILAAVICFFRDLTSLLNKLMSSEESWASALLPLNNETPTSMVVTIKFFLGHLRVSSKDRSGGRTLMLGCFNAYAPIRPALSRILRTEVADRKVLRSGSSDPREFASFMIVARLSSQCCSAKSFFRARA
jgi:hypothetical protein